MKFEALLGMLLAGNPSPQSGVVDASSVMPMRRALPCRKSWRQSVATVAALVGWSLSAAAGNVEVLSSQGQSQATYDTVSEALENVPADGTVRLLADENVRDQPTVVRSCKLDLNGFTLGQKYFTFNSDVKLSVDGNGGKINGRDSVFYMAANCSVALTNVAISAHNLVYTPGAGCRVDVFADTKIGTS